MVIDRGAGEDQPVVGGALERADGKAQPGEVAVDVERHLVGIIAVGVRPAGEELPFVVHHLPVQADRGDGGAVHIAEMCTVRTVFGDDLGMHRFVLGESGELRIGPVVRVRPGLELWMLGEDVRQFPFRRFAVRLVPHEHHAVLFDDRVGAQPQTAVGLVGLVRDVAVGAVAAPAPAMERAFDAVADDLAAMAQVRAEMLAVALHQMQLAVFVAPGDQVLAKVPECFGLAGGKLRRPADHEPAGDLPGERNFHGVPPDPDRY